MTATSPQLIAAAQLLGCDPENLLKAIEPDAERLLSVSEAAERLGLGERTVWRYIRKGKLAAKRIGPKRVLIAERALLAFVENAPTAAAPVVRHKRQTAGEGR